MKKKLAVFIYSTHDRLFASVVTALSFHNHHKNDDYDMYLIVDYDSKSDEFSAPHSRLNDSLAIKKILPKAKIIFDTEEVNKFFDGINPSTKDKMLNCPWGRSIWAKLIYLRYLDHYNYVMHLDNDVLVIDNINKYLPNNFFCLGKGNSLAIKHKYLAMSRELVPSLKIEDVDSVNAGVIIYSDLIKNNHELCDHCVTLANELVQSVVSQKYGITEEFILFLAFKKMGLSIQNCSYLQKAPREVCNDHEYFCVHSANREKFWSHRLMRSLYPEWYAFYRQWTDIAKGRPYSGHLVENLYRKKKDSLSSMICAPIWSYYFSRHLKSLLENKYIFLLSDFSHSSIQLRVQKKQYQFEIEIHFDIRNPNIVWLLAFNNIQDEGIQEFLKNNHINRSFSVDDTSQMIDVILRFVNNL